MVFWPVVTAHLIDLAGYHFTPIRDRALHVLTSLIHAALKHPRQPPIHVRLLKTGGLALPVMQETPSLQLAILSPLRNLSLCGNVEAVRYQLDCVKQVQHQCTGGVGSQLRTGAGRQRRVACALVAHRHWHRARHAEHVVLLRGVHPPRRIRVPPHGCRSTSQLNSPCARRWWLISCRLCRCRPSRCFWRPSPGAMLTTHCLRHHVPPDSGCSRRMSTSA